MTYEEICNLRKRCRRKAKPNRVSKQKIQKKKQNAKHGKKSKQALGGRTSWRVDELTAWRFNVSVERLTSGRIGENLVGWVDVNKC